MFLLQYGAVQTRLKWTDDSEKRTYETSAAIFTLAAVRTLNLTLSQMFFPDKGIKL
jgi:hypothetical protein